MLVDFYQLGGSPLEDVIASIAAKLMVQDARLLLVAGDEALLGKLDRLLWDQGPASFLPHGIAGGPDDGLAQELIAAGEATGDMLWRMPLAESFDRLIDSPIADMKNVGPREGGSITAAQFIQRFVDDGVKWAHLDIAGKAWSDKASATYDKGATGFGVRLLDQFVETVVEG